MRIEVDVAIEIDVVDVVMVLNDDGFAVGLSHESVDFGVSVLAIDDDLRTLRAVASRGVGVADASLQLEYNWTCGIDDFDVVLTSDFVGFGWFAMCSKQHFHVVQVA